MDEILDLILEAPPGQEEAILSEAVRSGKISAEDADTLRASLDIAGPSSATTTQTSSMAPPPPTNVQNHPNVAARPSRDMPTSFQELMDRQAKPPFAPSEPGLPSIVAAAQAAEEGDPTMATYKRPGANPTPGMPSPTRLGYEELTTNPSGRRFLFENFLNASPGFRQTNPFAQNVVRKQNDRLQADFMTDAARSLMGGGGDRNMTYRDWLGGGSANRVNPGDLDQFRSLFNRDPMSLSAEQAAARQQLDENADFLIPTTASMGVSPLFRDAMANQVGQRMSAFQDKDLETSLFDEFFRRGGRF